MPKLKTHKGAQKRLKITANGKIKRRKAYASHMLTKKNAKRRRNLKQATLISKEESKRVKELLPYG